ncbi:MAG: hypothetical protein ACRDO7_12790 [Nocardioidaceae bacterium]
MTEIDPEPVSDEADFIDQHIDIEDLDLEAELDDPAAVELHDDAWDADIADVADQHTPALLDDEG